ncbi:MAG: alkaline shock response membrane anchor protein AmaP [Clostridia bacterium]|jgi:uncharacterized alkaline shock family protein YloU|nr:alkaline shock response membrane anchor protein AmaP [Clostridia bacterium]MBT7123290.1 alkaline shock response membrane anchor protein AmaP [Clostridia bacterium]
MRIFMRILLTLFLLCMLFIAVILLFGAWNIIDISYPHAWTFELYSNVWTQVIVSTICIIVIAVCFTLMFARSRKREAKSALITQTGTGAISISLSAIEEMASKHILANDLIKNAKVGVSSKEAKVNLTVKLAVAEGTNIPEVLQSLQASTKQEIETYAGVEVGKIVLLVEKTAQVVKARVE